MRVDGVLSQARQDRPLTSGDDQYSIIVDLFRHLSCRDMSKAGHCQLVLRDVQACGVRQDSRH